MRHLITTNDAAAIYNIPARTIRNWHHAGRLTNPIRHKGRYYWNTSEIDQLAHQRNGHAHLPRPPSLRRRNQVAHTP